MDRASVWKRMACGGATEGVEEGASFFFIDLAVREGRYNWSSRHDYIRGREGRRDPREPRRRGLQNQLVRRQYCIFIQISTCVNLGPDEFRHVDDGGPRHLRSSASIKDFSWVPNLRGANIKLLYAKFAVPREASSIASSLVDGGPSPHGHCTSARIFDRVPYSRQPHCGGQLRKFSLGKQQPTIGNQPSICLPVWRPPLER